MTDPVAAPLDVVVVASAVGLPHGMAATSRVRLYCRALASVGDSVRILLTTVTERPPDILNTEARGVVDGIPFEYTTGTPLRARRFLHRRFVEARAGAVTVVRLAALRRGGRRLVVLAYVGTSHWCLSYLVLTSFARVLRIPLVLDLCEAPWALRADRKVWERAYSPLALTSGAITISTLLTRWADADYASRRSNATATEVPVLVDVDEVRSGPYPDSAQMAIYAVSSGYDASVSFVVAAMRHVWTRRPDCRLVITGMAAEDLDRALAGLRLSDAEAARVRAVGRVSHDALLELYSQASVCLAPLFDDLQSRARFPTKIAEYAAAARPVVTSAVGEVVRYLEDGTTAFIAQPGDAAVFAGKIVEALSNPELAAAVGVRARDLAEERFDYRGQAARIHEALASTPERRSGRVAVRSTAC